MKNVVAVVLAAGKGTRMKSELPKVLHQVCGLPLITHVVRQIRRAGIKRIVVVVGYRKKLVSECLRGSGVEFVEQRPQLGTAHALLVTERKLRTISGNILVLDGDVIFEDSTALKDFYADFKKQECAASILTTTLENPFGYGRIVRDAVGTVTAIREELDATDAEREVKEVNTGIYLFAKKNLYTILKHIKKNPRKKEYYLTDSVALYHARDKKVGTFSVEETQTVLGINDRSHLADIHTLMKARILREHQQRGVTVLEPASTYIEADVRIGPDTVIYPYTYIEKNVRIGSGCNIGPFCKIRMGSTIKSHSNIGTFVEITRSRIGSKTNIKHLSYIGDAVVGDSVNIGAGTITANYDGRRKHKTRIGNGAFIGSDTVLIAPLSVGAQAKTGAGSVVPKNKNIPRGRTAVGVPARIIPPNRKQ